MNPTLKRSANIASTLPPGRLPATMRVLYIASRQRTGGWLADAFAADSATKVDLEEAVGAAEGAARLRDESFDAVLVSHDPDQLDALGLIDGLRGGGIEEPIIILGDASQEEMAALAFEVGADAYLCASTATTRTLIWLVARATERHNLARENSRLTQAECQRLHAEQSEATRRLEGHRALLQSIQGMFKEHPETPADEPSPRIGESSGKHDDPWAANASADVVPLQRTAAPALIPAPLVAHYREILKTYVIMGSGNLGGEMSTLAHLLVTANVTTQEVLQLHLHVLEELVQGLGNRSARHVMTRADLLILEVMLQLAGGYRRRCQEYATRPKQRMLPGFNAAEASLYEGQH